jgi:hypothetical protein
VFADGHDIGRHHRDHLIEGEELAQVDGLDQEIDSRADGVDAIRFPRVGKMTVAMNSAHRRTLHATIGSCLGSGEASPTDNWRMIQMRMSLSADSRTFRIGKTC